MKKSEDLKKEAAESDNDFQAMSLLNKSLRENRLERFQDYIIPLQQKGYDIVEDNFKYTIDTDSQSIMYGIIDYFPKANKLLIRKQNRWIKPGLAWITKNLL
jgi:DNA-binding winged helix-turn-helix (wHTH) protein